MTILAIDMVFQLCNSGFWAPQHTVPPWQLPIASSGSMGTPVSETNPTEVVTAAHVSERIHSLNSFMAS